MGAIAAGAGVGAGTGAVAGAVAGAGAGTEVRWRAARGSGAAALSAPGLPLWLLALAVALTAWPHVIAARRTAPLIGEDGGRRPARVAECSFGKQPKELGSTWFADLGPPFGVMYCIKCECIAVQKKRRIVAHVQCRNIKHECPTPTCTEPVLEPGRCCKTCPGDGPRPDVTQDVPVNLTVEEEEERNMKYFAALLTGRTSQFLYGEDTPLMGHGIPRPLGDTVATGRFVLYRRNLHYSFYISSGRSRPSAVQFVNNAGNILQEHMLPPASEYQNRTSKVCGVWRRVPREYRHLLRERKIYVSLLWGSGPNRQMLSGHISWYHYLNTELFSALLEPTSAGLSGTGGAATVSVYAPGPTHAPSAAIYISILFNGVFTSNQETNVPLTVRLEKYDTRRLVLEEVVYVNNPSHELNVIEVRSPVSFGDLNLLTRGQLILSVKSISSPEVLSLKGRVVTRTTCELFQAILSAADSGQHENITDAAVSTRTRVSGLAWMYVSRDGALVYNIQIDNLEAQDVLILTLVAGRGRHRIEFEDFTPSLQGGRANGSIALLNPRELEQLYAGELALNAATQTEASLVRGRLIPRPLVDARDAVAPTLLKRPTTKQPTSLVGFAWLAVDMECTLHYEVVLAGLSHSQWSFYLYLELLPILAPGAPKSTRLLEHFQGAHIEGFLIGLPQSDLSKLEFGVAYLDIRDNITEQSVLKGMVKQVNVPSICLPQITDNDVPPLNYQHLGREDSPEVSSCFYEKRFYDDGMQWTSAQNPCIMCSCHHSKVHCDAVICPPLNCDSKPQPGECCPACSNSSRSQESNTSAARGCYLANQYHKAGSIWHPYLPPNGFDTCAVCSCNPTTLEVNCPRVRCPTLECNERDAFRPDKKACCRQCPPKLESIDVSDTQTQHDEKAYTGTVLQRTAEQILANGGCKNPRGPPYENGKEWHPRLHSYGEYKCVTCYCKDGIQTCERQRCGRSTCHGAKKRILDECCPQCRRYRHTRHRAPVNT